MCTRPSPFRAPALNGDALEIELLESGFNRAGDSYGSRAPLKVFSQPPILLDIVTCSRAPQKSSDPSAIALDIFAGGSETF